MRKLILAATAIAALAVPAIAPAISSAASPADKTCHCDDALGGTIWTRPVASITGVDSSGGPVWAYDNVSIKCRYTGAVRTIRT